MIQSPQPDENKSETSACEKNHLAIAVGICLLSIIPSLLFLTAGLSSIIFRNDSIAFVFALLLVLGCLYVLCVALWEAINLIHNKGLSSCCRKGRIAVATGLCLMPWILSITSWILAPGGLSPFFHISNVMLILAATALWQALGLILLIRTQSPILSFLAMLFFILPAGLMILFFPVSGWVVLTLLNMVYPKK